MRRVLARLTYRLPFWRLWVALDDWLFHHASRHTCHWLTGCKEAWCSLAWRTRHRRLSRVLIKIVGEDHARESWERYWK